MSIDKEALGKMVNDIWNGLEGFGTCTWEYLDDENKRAYSEIGQALWQAGFEAGADSVVPEC
jgi:hypothetical protein